MPDYIEANSASHRVCRLDPCVLPPRAIMPVNTSSAPARRPMFNILVAEKRNQAQRGVSSVSEILTMTPMRKAFTADGSKEPVPTICT